MKAIQYFNFILLFILPNISLSQNEIFVDENNNKISFEILKKKCEAEMFYCLTYSTDSLTINKIHRKHYFGKLPENQFLELKKLLGISNQEKELDNYFLTLADTLYNNKERLQLHNQHILKHNEELKKDSTNTIRIQHAKLTEKRLDKKYTRAVKKYKKCRKKILEKFNSDIYVLYTYDKDYLKNHNGFNWKNDSISFIENLKFSTSVNASTMIIKTNGEYYVGCCYNNKNQFEMLLKNKNWNMIKADYNASINSLSKRGIGFFKKNYNAQKSDCHINF